MAKSEEDFSVAAKRSFMWGRLLRSLAAMIVGLTLAVLPALTANAAGTILVSDDGVTFGPTYSSVLFDGISRIVPGDTQSEVFYVRNTGPDAGYLRVTLRDVTGDPTLTAGLAVSVSVPAKSGVPATLSKAAPCWVLNEGILLAAGATMTVTASLAFDSTSGNPTQTSTADFDIVASLTDTAVALPPTECGGAGTTVPGTIPGPSALSYTGGEVPIMLVIVTAFMVGAGLFLVVAARRRRQE